MDNGKQDGPRGSGCEEAGIERAAGRFGSSRGGEADGGGAAWPPPLNVCEHVEARVGLDARSLIREDVGELLEGCRQYLSLVAEAEVASDLRVKMGVSDLVQETFLQAQQDLGQFRGRSREELLAWLRQILLHRLSWLGARYRRTLKRDLAREGGPWQTSLDFLDQLFDSDQTSPSGCVVRAEKVELVRRAIASLPADSRKVVVLRYRERLKFSEIATKLGRSPDAVRMLWYRAVDRLADALERCHE